MLQNVTPHKYVSANRVWEGGWRAAFRGAAGGRGALPRRSC